MPIYEYACDTCQMTFERKQKFSDDPIRECPECGNSVRRVLYPAGIIFKGSGFYATDNRPTSGTSTTSSNGSSGTESTAKSDSTTTKSESKSSSSTAADS